MFKKGRVAVAATVAVVFSLAAGWHLCCQAKATAEQLSKIIDDSKILGSDTEVRAEVHEGEKEVVVYATRNPKATDKDCKIDAVLIAKKVMDADPTGISKVKVTFLDQSNKDNFRQVTVRAGDVKAYAARVIDQQELMEELELVIGQTGATAPRGATLKGSAKLPEVGPGVLSGERANLLAQIQGLRAKGVGVGPFMAQFSQIEARAKSGTEAEVAGSIENLTEAVNRQTEQLQKIQEHKRLMQFEPYHRMMERRRQSDTSFEDRNQDGSNRRRMPGNPGGTEGQKPGGADFKEKWKRMGEEWQQKMSNLGDLTPAEGPAHMRRGRIGMTLKQMRDNREDINPFMALWHDMERMASGGDQDGVDSRATQLENALGLSSWHHHKKRHDGDGHGPDGHGLDGHGPDGHGPDGRGPDFDRR